MDLGDFKLALKEMKLILGVELELEPAILPGFQKVKNVKVEGDYQLLLRLDGEEVVEVVKLHRKKPRSIDPQEFIYEVRDAAFDEGEACLS